MGYLDLTGQKYGRLTCLFTIGARSDQGTRIWVCRCDCGNTIERTTRQLRDRGVRSCGCLHPVRVAREREDAVMALLDAPLTHLDIQKKTGIPRSTVDAILRRFHTRKAIHIHDWEARCRPLWLRGEGVDAPRPEPFTLAERARRFRARRKLEGK